MDAMTTFWTCILCFLSGLLILLLLKYEFASSLNTLCLLLGFGAWAVFLSLVSEREDEKARGVAP